MDRRKNVLTVWLCLFALLFQIGFTGVLPLKPNTDLTVQQRDSICSSLGLVRLDGEIPADGKAHHPKICVFCLPLMHGGLLGSGIVLTMQALVWVKVVICDPVSDVRYLRKRTSLAVSPRGPPLG